jgi:phospholipid/cholesterol/gamma-HCH transport system ATP-binding protein
VDHLVDINQVCFSRNHRVIFDNVNIQVKKGQIVAILGPSGSGKTTLLRLIGGQLLPDKGQIIVHNKEVAKLRNHQLYKLRRKMGLLFQSSALFTDLSIFENVAFPLREHTHLSESMIRDLVLMKLEAVGLRGARNLMPHELSGGMQRRAALARTIALDPSIVMYDEPFTGQDPISMGVLVKLIKLLNESAGITSIIVSHDVPETMSIADYVYIIAEGRIIGEGTPEVLMAHQSDWVAQFLKGEADGPVPFHYPACTYKEDLIGIKGA